MHYHDDAAEFLPAHPARDAGKVLLDGRDDGKRRPARQSMPEAETRRTAVDGPRGPRRRPRLLEGVPLPVADTGHGRPRAGQLALPGTPAALRAPRTGDVPLARPSEEGRPGGPRDRDEGTGVLARRRRYRRVADGLAITPRVSVIVPTINEAENLPAVFATIPDWVDEVVLVDGRSTDNTIEVAISLRPDVRVVLQGGVGKGDALVAGFTAATGEIVVAIDGDGSTDGNEIVRFVSALMAGADYAKGSRFSSSGDSDDVTPIRRAGNRVLNLMVNRLFKTSFTDLCYGYNAFWSHHLASLSLDSPGFEVETLMSIRAAEAGLQIYEVPSHERQRQHGSSNLSAVKDGWRILRLIASEKRAATLRKAQQQRETAKRRKAAQPKPFMAPGYLAHDVGCRDLPADAVVLTAEQIASRENGGA